MSLTQLDYPVTGEVGSFENIFPSQRALNVNFNRTDVTIASIASGTGLIVELTLSSVLDADLLEGDFVVWETDSYKLRTSKVVQVISTTVIEVDEVFTSTDATNGFMNYRKSWFLEARFVAATTPTDEQDNVELVIEDFSQVPNALDGSVVLDISIVKDVLIPDFSLQTEIAEGLFQIYKFQFRESFTGNRDGTWISPNVGPANDTPIMLVLATKDIAFNEFVDEDVVLPIRFIESYPTLFSFIYSDVNDEGATQLTFRYEQYKINKELINSTEIGVFNDDSGVINLFIPASEIQPRTVFIKAFVDVVTSNAQYDPTQYDPAQYA